LAEAIAIDPGRRHGRGTTLGDRVELFGICFSIMEASLRRTYSVSLGWMALQRLLMPAAFRTCWISLAGCHETGGVLHYAKR
jgi:hypothetical protein